MRRVVAKNWQVAWSFQTMFWKLRLYEGPALSAYSRRERVSRPIYADRNQKCF